MRWLIIALLAVNTAYLISGWVQFSHLTNYGERNDSGSAHSRGKKMPGAAIILIKEQPSIQLNQKSRVNMYGLGDSNADMTKELENNGSRCRFIGPLKTGEVWKPADALSEALALGVEARLIDVEVNNAVDYWVYIPPSATREAALQKLRELQKKQIDSYVIPDGELHNGVSIGVFDKKSNAERRQNEILQMGYNAEIIESKRKSNEIWMQINTGNENKPTDELIMRIKQRDEEIKLNEVVCDNVASWKDIN